MCCEVFFFYEGNTKVKLLIHKDGKKSLCLPRKLYHIFRCMGSKLIRIADESEKSVKLMGSRVLAVLWFLVPCNDAPSGQGNQRNRPGFPFYSVGCASFRALVLE